LPNQEIFKNIHHPCHLTEHQASPALFLAF